MEGRELPVRGGGMAEQNRTEAAAFYRQLQQAILLALRERGVLDAAQCQAGLEALEAEREKRGRAEDVRGA